MSRAFERGLTGGTPEAQGLKLLRKLGVHLDVEELLQATNDIERLPSGVLGRFAAQCVSPRRKSSTLREYASRMKEHVRNLIRFRRALLSSITQMCLRFDRAKAERLYTEMLRVSASRSVPIFTTNYDSVLDHVALMAQIRISDNFKRDALSRSFWDESMASLHEPGLQLVKLHGSIEWHQTDDGLIEKLKTPAPRNQEGQTLRQLLVFPTRIKDIYNPTYFPLYTRFLSAVEEARALYVVGHSLRDEYLRAAIRDRLRDPEFTLVIVDPSEPQGIKSDAEDFPKPESRYVHLQFGADKVMPLLLQAIDGLPVGDVAAHLRGAANRVRARSKSKIQLSEAPPQWVMPAETIEAEVAVDTLVADAKVVCTVDPSHDAARRRALSIEYPDHEPGDWSVLGAVKDRRRVRIRLPDDLEEGESLLFRIALESHGGVHEGSTPQRTYRLRTRKT